MTENKPKKIRKQILCDLFGNPDCAGTILKNARRSMGLSRDYLAAKLGVTEKRLTQYENGCCAIPTYLLLRIFMFGLDFYIPHTDTNR